MSVAREIAETLLTCVVGAFGGRLLGEGIWRWREVSRLTAERDSIAVDLARERNARIEAERKAAVRDDRLAWSAKSKAVLRRRMGHVIGQARAWKRVAVAYGWTRGDKAPPGVLCACDEWRGSAHLEGCRFGRPAPVAVDVPMTEGGEG